VEQPAGSVVRPAAFAGTGDAGSTSNFDLSYIGDLIGGIFGGFTKSIGSG
jgi:hypothetical protein